MTDRFTEVNFSPFFLNCEKIWYNLHDSFLTEYDDMKRFAFIRHTNK